ncbi:hypothetical protein HDV00_008476 [Rhizophlyctis rosea]|nr:hypothetical protein HDV00_008476 [Rhizophlyctis rosea]
MYHNERQVFSRLASQCAQLSASEPILFDQDDGSEIKFSPLSEARFEELRVRVLENASQTNQPPTPGNAKEPETLAANIRTFTNNLSKLLYNS